jgi:hypothetical protein
LNFYRAAIRLHFQYFWQSLRAELNGGHRMSALPSREARFSATLKDLPDETLLTVDDVVALGVAKKQTLSNWRVQHCGPHYIILGSGTRYPLGDLRAWIKAGGSRGSMHRHVENAA